MEERIEMPRSCGFISINRCNGRTDLYGSPFTHEAFIEIRITGASESKGISRTLRYPDRSKNIARIWLSTSQFAQAITTFGHSEGTPCTVRNIGNQAVPEFKLNSQVPERIKYEQQGLDHLKESIAALDSAIKLARQLKTKKEREEMLESLEKSRRELSDRLLFVSEMFLEYMNSVEQQAKTEVAAYCDLAVVRLGLQSIQSDSHIIELADTPSTGQLILPPGDGD
jgi:hypothetical protein